MGVRDLPFRFLILALVSSSNLRSKVACVCSPSGATSCKLVQTRNVATPKDAAPQV